MGRTTKKASKSQIAEWWAIVSKLLGIAKERKDRVSNLKEKNDGAAGER